MIKQISEKTVAITVIFSLIMVILPATTLAETISFTGNNYNVNPGEVFSVPVNLGSAVDATTVTFRVTFDPSVITYMSLTPSPFYSTGDPGCFIMPMVTENPAGTLEATLSRFGCGPGVSGSGELATISFQGGAGDGMADIDFTMFNVCHSDFSCADHPLGNSATVTVGNPDTVAPVVTILEPTDQATYIHESDDWMVYFSGVVTDNYNVASINLNGSVGGGGHQTGISKSKTFSFGSSMKEGENTIVVTARDSAGNEGSDTIVVTYIKPVIITPEINFSNTNYNVDADSNLSVPVMASDLNDATTVQFNFSYDPTYLSYVNVMPGSLLTATCFMVMPMVMENPQGTVDVILSGFGCPGANGSGEIARLMFNTNSTGGSSNLIFNQFSVSHSDFTMDFGILGSNTTVNVIAASDTTAPVITLNGDRVMNLSIADTYNEPGAMALDNVDGDISSSVVISGFVDTSLVGTYSVAYNVTDSSGNSASPEYRTVNVTTAPDTTRPDIIIEGFNPAEVGVGESYTDSGASAWDNRDGDITDRIIVTDNINTATEGMYYVRYNVSDNAGNAATEAVRTVIVVPASVDTEAPGITINGANPYNLEVGETYVDPGASAWDEVDGDLSYKIITANPVDTASAGSYQVRYRVSDSSGNEGSAERTVVVTNSTVQTADVSMGTKEIGGYIGAKKSIRVKNIGQDNLSEVEIELPYNDNGNATTRRFAPEGVRSGSVSITMPAGTFSGIGRVYYRGEDIGVFNYNVIPRLTSVTPVKIIVGEELTIEVDSFIPKEGNTLVVMSLRNSQGKTYREWLKPNLNGSSATTLKMTVPAGASPGKIYVHTSYAKIDGKEKIIKSNAQGYKIQPIIDSVEWSARGYEQVGDKLLIKGRGISTGPVVNFYSADKVKLDSKRAKVISIGETEVIEVVSTIKENSYLVTVKSGGEESLMEESLANSAKPRLNQVKTKYNRRMQHNKESMPGAKIGDEVTLVGQGLLSLSGEVVIEFQGQGKRIKTAATQTDKNGRTIKTLVPAGAQSGYLKVILNGEDSNHVPLEIIPTIVSVNPDPVEAGEEITIIAEGVGPSEDLLKIHYNNGWGNKSELLKPKNIYFENNYTHIVLAAPKTISSKNSKLRLQYDKWLDNGEAVLNVKPKIMEASMNMDTNILSIKGYGFSIRGKENRITYRYADDNKTVISPKAKILGVYPTEEGQEIRVKIMDNYHYGDVSVGVGEQVSNTSEFGPVYINKIHRRVEHVKSIGEVKGVLYITGYNFGDEGGVKVGEVWADIHYRSNFLIIAVVDKARVYDNPVIVTKQ